jgi:late competence protein required for DNA uptake (superfamily II DNA/RNA helicase)
MKCGRCGKELTENQSYVYQGKVMCEDCLMDVGLSLKECDPWATYVDTSARKRHGLTGAAGLTEMQAKVYDFIKAKGKVTREEVMKNFGLSEADLKAQLLILMHAELVKERSERSRMYLVPIS